jgi:hypothetical protein
MNTKRISRFSFNAVLTQCALVLTFVMATAIAVAQENSRAAAKADNENVFESLGRWFERQGEKIGSTFRDAGKGFENFGHEAGVAARSTVDGAKDTAGAVARIPAARVVSGHEKCRTAPNGAPDCLAAASVMCRAKGFETGKSMDMTTAEVCPAQVYLSGRSSGPGCRTETFISRALCQ